MCGIVGMAGNLTTNCGKMFRDMLVFDTVRGFDSTGVVYVDTVSNSKSATLKEPIIEKDIGPPQELWERYQSNIFDYRGYPKWVGRVLIGHNRAATVGKINVENAHPFKFNNVYGVHNGSLRFYQDLDGYKDHDVDSKCLLQTIANKGIAKTWRLFTGAAALVWWDDTKQTINFVRNKERPLHVAYSENKDSIFWASESWMISIAASRNGINLLKDDNKEDDIRYFEENYHYSYEVSNVGYKTIGRVKLEPRVFTWPAQKTTSTGVGFKGGYQNPKKKDTICSRVLNTGWAKNMKRGDKDTRGVVLELTHRLDGGNTYIARPISEGPIKSSDTVFIYVVNHYQKEQLTKAFESGNTKFKTVARMRFEERAYTVKNYLKWGISSQGLKPVIRGGGTKLAVVVDNDKVQDDLPRYKTFNGDYVSKERWLSNITSGNYGNYCSCAWCSEALIPEESEEMVFLSKSDVLCPECSKNEEVLDNLYYVYPEAFGKKESVNVH